MYLSRYGSPRHESTHRTIGRAEYNAWSVLVFPEINAQASACNASVTCLQHCTGVWPPGVHQKSSCCAPGGVGGGGGGGVCRWGRHRWDSFDRPFVSLIGVCKEHGGKCGPPGNESGGQTTRTHAFGAASAPDMGLRGLCVDKR